MSHGLFYQCPRYVSGAGNISAVMLSMEGQSSRISSKHVFICVPKMNKGLTGLERHECLVTEFSFLGELSL